MKNIIVVENTPYSLFIYWLKEGTKGTITYVLDSRIDKTVIENLRKNNEVLVYDTMRSKGFLAKLFYVYGWRKIKLYWQVRKKIKNSDIYGNDSIALFDIFRKYKYTLLEDGLGNYINLGKFSLSKLILGYTIRGFKHALPYGISDNCQKIYLAGLATVPDRIKYKSEIINLKQLWEAKSSIEQNEILEIFNFKKEYFSIFQNKNIYLLTQTLSEDGYMTEEEKIDIYRDIISNLNISNLVIKPHPREKTNYKKHFKDISVLDSPIPFELFDLVGLKIDKVITLFSAAALNIDKDIELEWLGTYNHPKLKKYEKTILKNIKP